MELFRVEFKFDKLHCSFMGYEQCSSKYKYGPYLRGEYIFHYILSGKGKYNCNGRTFTVKPGQGFLIRPNDETMYCADEKNPWCYFWMNLEGDVEHIFSRLRLDREHLIYSSSNATALTAGIYSVIEELRKEDNTTYRKMSLLFQVLHLLSCYSVDSTPKTLISPIERACDIIESNLTHPHRISQLAVDVGLERNVFSRMFKKEKGMSPKQYIVNLRLSKAAEYLQKTDMSVSSIAYSLGYSNVVEFSKQFKKYYEITPSQLREQVGRDLKKAK